MRARVSSYNLKSYDKGSHSHTRLAPLDSGPHFGCHPLFGNCRQNEFILHEKKILYNE